MKWTNMQDIEECLPKDIDPDGMASRCWNQIKTCIKEDDNCTADLKDNSLFVFLANTRNINTMDTIQCSQEVIFELENLLGKLEELLFPVIFLLYERFKFFHRLRGSEEKVEYFLNVLDMLADTCEFGKIREERIKEQLLIQGALHPVLKQAIESCPSSKLKTLLESFSESKLNHYEEPLHHEQLLNQYKSYLPTQRNQAEGSLRSKVNEATLKKRNLSVKASHGSSTVNSIANKNRKREGKDYTKMLDDNIRSRKISVSGVIASMKSPTPDEEEVEHESTRPGYVHDEIKCIDDTGDSSRGKRKERPSLELLDKVIDVAAELIVGDRSEGDTGKPKRSSDGNLQAERFFPCQACSEIFSMKEINEKQLGVCPSCGHMFDLPSKLSIHLSEDREVRCKSETVAKQSTRGRYHKEYTCSECGLRIHGKRSFIKHMNSHKLYCDICNKVLDCKYTHRLHMDGHRGNKPYSCAHCSRSFTRKSDLKTHAEIHNPERKKRHVCDFCGKDFYRIHELIRHSRLHTGDKTHVCDVCNKGFPTAHGLKCHRVLHTGIKSFTCDKCGKSFAQKSNLVMHLMRHTGIKEHECSTCGMMFARKGYLESHRRTHSKEKLYTCETCGTCVSSRYSLQRHRLIHSGLKPHVCPNCDQSFTWQSTYKKHMESHKMPDIVKYSRMNEESLLHKTDDKRDYHCDTHESKEKLQFQHEDSANGNYKDQQNKKPT